MGKSLIRNGLELMQTWNRSSSSWKKVKIENWNAYSTSSTCPFVIGECKWSCVPRRCGSSQVWAHGRTAPVRLLSCSSNFILVCGNTIVFDTAPFCRSRLGKSPESQGCEQRAKKCTLTMQYGSMSRLVVSLCQIWSTSTLTPWRKPQFLGPGLMECHCNFRKKSGTWKSESSKSQAWRLFKDVR